MYSNYRQFLMNIFAAVGRIKLHGLMMQVIRLCPSSKLAYTDTDCILFALKKEESINLQQLAGLPSPTTR